MRSNLIKANLKCERAVARLTVQIHLTRNQSIFTGSQRLNKREANGSLKFAETSGIQAPKRGTVWWITVCIAVRYSMLDFSVKKKKNHTSSYIQRKMLFCNLWAAETFLLLLLTILVDFTEPLSMSRCTNAPLGK